ncbi:MAG: sigma-70 family RNA polymerase sigma factor [Patescibacteria group bacterium]|nr:sigma-70 family RNA polymerase sigma factor [Patescibacteria group bacterium]
MKEKVHTVRSNSKQPSMTVLEESMSEKTDNELVLLSLENQENFLYLVQRYEKKLLSYIIRISGVKYEDAQDVLQDAFVSMFLKLNSFDSRLKFSSWAYRIVHNQTITDFRKRKVRPVQYFEENDLVRLVDSMSSDDHFDKKLLQDEIKTILDKMDKKYREVLVLKFLEEKDYNEISDILKKPVGTVGTLVNRAKKKFLVIYEKQTQHSN